MSWKEVDIVKLRKQFIEEHLGQNHASFTALCDGYGISRKTGYKWVGRFMKGGFNNLVNRSSAPIDSTAGLILDRVGLVKRKKERWQYPLMNKPLVVLKKTTKSGVLITKGNSN